jgi:hypothetical protein
MRERDDMNASIGGPGFFRQAKTWIAGAAGLYFVALVALNSASVEVKLGFTTLNMSLSLLILLCGALGFCVGWIVGRTRRARRLKS